MLAEYLRSLNLLQEKKKFISQVFENLFTDRVLNNVEAEWQKHGIQA